MLTCTAFALGLTLGSYHFNRENPNLRPFNPGAYAICDEWTGGIYRNSFGRPSVFGGYVVKLGPVDATVGFATGYELRATGPHTEEGITKGKIAPLFLLSTKVGPVRLGVIPPMLPKQKGALTLGVEWAFTEKPF